MQNLPAHTNSEPAAHNPFARMQADQGGINHAVVAIEQEAAIAEVQGRITVAKRLPRDAAMARREAIEVCKDLDLAQVAFYSLPRGNESVEGPTIKLAEELARVWGNIDYGHRELSRNGEQSVVEVYAWDMQTNTTSKRQLTVRHVIDLSGGRERKCKSEKEIDDLTARKASSMLRGRILGVLPKALVNAAIAQCRETLKGGGGIPLAERIDKMVGAFGKIKVTPEMLIKRLGHPLDQTSAEELVEMIGVFTSIKEGHFTVEDQFPDQAPGGEDAAAQASAAETVANQAKAAAAAPAKDDGKKTAGTRGGAKAVEKKAPEASQQREPTPAEQGSPDGSSADAQNAGTLPKEPAGEQRVDTPAEDKGSKTEGDYF